MEQAWGWRALRVRGLARLEWVGLALLLLALAAVYGPTLTSFFVSDDLDMLSGDASDLFSPASGFGRFMPLAATVHRAVALTSGLDPVPAHSLQLGLHVASTILVYALTRRLIAPRGGARSTLAALGATVVFALYPRHHQVVMWFGAVSIGLAATLALATALVFLRAWSSGDARAGWAAVGLYAAALLSHESAVVLPALLAAITVYEWAAGRGPRPLRAPPWLWAGAGVLVAHLTLLAWAYRARAAAHPDSGYRFIGLGADLLSAPLRYAAQLAVPPPWTELLAVGTAGSVVGGLVVLAGLVGFWRGGPTVWLGLAWAAIAAAPFVLFGVYGVTDRYYYLPSVGLAVVAAVAVARWPRPAAAGLAVYVLVGLVLLVQVGAEWRAAGATTRAVLDSLDAWARAETGQQSMPEAVLFVGTPFKRGERWPGSQVYVFSTGLVGAAHLATGWPALRVSYVFQDEHPTLAAELAALPSAPGPPGLHLFALDGLVPTDRTDRLRAALPRLAPLRWRGTSRTPVDWSDYAAAAPAAAR